jgi:protein-disulfide isomerase
MESNKMKRMKKVLALTAVITLLACSSSPAQQGTAGNETAARIGDRTITVKELEERWNKLAPAEHAEAIQKVYDGRRAALDEIIADVLVGDAAKAKGMTPEAFTQAEVSKRVKKITDGDVVSFYQANIGQMQGRSLEQMTPVINRYLQEQADQSAKQALVAELRKAGPTVRVMLEAPRAAIALQPADPSIGNTAAPVTIVEFSDFQCPYCQRAAPTLKQLREKYGEKVRVVWKDFPLTQIHPQAFRAAEAGHCAAEQGKFWEYHDKLFASQQALQPDFLKQYAKEMSLDGAKFDACMDASKYAEQVRDNVAAGSQLGVNSTPTLFVNGRRLEGAQPYDVIASVIDEELAK